MDEAALKAKIREYRAVIEKLKKETKRQKWWDVWLTWSK
jgi:hypothetical protein